MRSPWPALAGLALALAVGPQLLVVGAAAIAAGWFYTGGPRPYGYAGFGELFVFVFFGAGGHRRLGLRADRAAHRGWRLVAAVPVGLLATALLVVNNLRDIPGDTESGKRTLAVRLGDRRTRLLYVGLLVVAFVCVPVVAGGFDRPVAALAAGRRACWPAARCCAVLSGARGRGPHPRARRHRPRPARHRRSCWPLGLWLIRLTG